ncbi:MAG: hypothetical protein PHU46_08510 [Rhodocyclaceae bacterium]|nr:hypothetical protein [Rhodocyclaceae bacterium]
MATKTILRRVFCLAASLVIGLASGLALADGPYRVHGVPVDDKTLLKKLSPDERQALLAGFAADLRAGGLEPAVESDLLAAARQAADDIGVTFPRNYLPRVRPWSGQDESLRRDVDRAPAFDAAPYLSEPVLSKEKLLALISDLKARQTPEAIQTYLTAQDALALSRRPANAEEVRLKTLSNRNALTNVERRLGSIEGPRLADFLTDFSAALRALQASGRPVTGEALVRLLNQTAFFDGARNNPAFPNGNYPGWQNLGAKLGERAALLNAGAEPVGVAVMLGTETLPFLSSPDVLARLASPLTPDVRQVNTKVAALVNGGYVKTIQNAVGVVWVSKALGELGRQYDEQIRQAEERGRKADERRREYEERGRKADAEMTQLKLIGPWVSRLLEIALVLGNTPESRTKDAALRQEARALIQKLNANTSLLPNTRPEIDQLRGQLGL